MPAIKHAIIAAAGIGHRLGLGSPKCLIDVDGRPLIEHLLARLADVPDIRIVTGFMALEVIEVARSARPDVIFVQNQAFRTTTTLTSYTLGAKGLKAPALFIDADIYFELESFRRFCDEASATEEAAIAVTPAGTEDCVYVERAASGEVVGFSSETPTPWEWANLAWLPPGMLEDAPTAVYEQIALRLPVRAVEIESFEVDTPKDLERLKAYLANWGAS